MTQLCLLDISISLLGKDVNIPDCEPIFAMDSRMKITKSLKA